VVRYFARRVAISITEVVAVSVLAFGLLRLAPGDPARTALGLYATPQALAAFDRQYGLSRPVPVQFWDWAKQVVHGNLGISISNHEPVGRLILSALPVTLELALLAFILTVVFGVPLGVVAALRQRHPVDGAIRLTSLVGVSIPGFVVGILLLLVFGWYEPNVLPYSGWVPLGDGIGSNLSHLVLPTIALSAASIGLVARLSRSSMLEVLDREYVTIAGAFGIPRNTVIWHDALKNALVPVVTILGLIATSLIGGAVVIEQIFALPGLGRLLVGSLEAQDYQVVSGLVLTFAIAALAFNLAVDLIYAWINPRIAARYRAEA
jgi:peptide/nickel transport system permease protein